MGRPRMTAMELELSGQDKFAPKRYENYNHSRGVIPCDVEIKPPRGISKRSKELWNTLVPDLLQMGVLSRTDFGELERLILLYDELQKIDAMIKECDKHKDIQSDKWVQRRAKLNGIMNTTQSNFTKVCASFGLHPTDRTRWPINEDNQKFKEEDPLDIIIGG